MPDILSQILSTLDEPLTNADGFLSGHQRDTSTGQDVKQALSKFQNELKTIEHNYIGDFAQTLDPLLSLNDGIKSCDELLSTMENILNGFQLDLSKLSNEISLLQEESYSMNIRLKNRSLTQKNIASVLEGSTISPEMIKIIFNSDVNDPNFLEAVQQLNKKLVYLKQNQDKNISALREISPAFETLKIKAGEKILEFFNEKIRALAAPNANVPILQQTSFIKNKTLFHFLAYRFPDFAIEIRSAYVQVLSSYYYTRFSKYVSRMQNLQGAAVDKGDMMGVEDGRSKGLFIAQKPNVIKDKPSVFTLGDRLNVLTSIQDAPVILPHVAEEQQQKFPYEVLFRSITRTLMDNACSEYVFATEFFCPATIKGERPPSIQLATEIFNEIFGKTLKNILDSVKSQIELSLDAISMLLCIRITAVHHKMLQSRRVPCLDLFMNNLTLNFWPRFQVIVDLHIQSIKKTILSGNLAVFDVHPNYIVRRYAEFSTSIFILNESFNDHLIETTMTRLRVEVEGFMQKVASEINDDRKKIIFYLNNLDLVVSILESGSTKSLDKEKQYFQNALERKIIEFCDINILPRLGLMFSIVSDFQDVEHVTVDQLKKAGKDFNANWKSLLAEINSDVLKSFSNFRNGASILQASFKQLISYYQKFIAIWNHKFSKNIPTDVVIVSVDTLITEIKSKYSDVYPK